MKADTRSSRRTVKRSRTSSAFSPVDAELRVAMAPIGAMRTRSSKMLLEPVVAVRLVVERGDLAVTARPVHGDRFDKGTVRLEPHDAAAFRCGPLFELSQQPPA